MKAEKIYVADGEFYLNDDGNIVAIELDYDCESPRDYEYNMGTFYTWMRGYRSPDDDRPADMQELGERFGLDIDDSIGQFCTAFMTESLGVAMPVYALDHSGVIYRAAYGNPFADPWDSGLAGVIFATNERIKELRCVPEVTREVRAEVQKEFEDEVELYNEWASGNCYGYIVTDKHGDEVDSCWGYIGSDAIRSGLAEACNGLNDCNYYSVDEFVEAHENDDDVVVDRYNELIRRAHSIESTAQALLSNIVNVRKIDVRFEGERLFLA